VIPLGVHAGHHGPAVDTHGPPSMPKIAVRRASRAALAATNSNLEGMQPARTHVVPHGPALISSTRAPAAKAALRAARPAVPAPTTATSTSTLSIAKLASR
jgi:hypothetical protein